MNSAMQKKLNELLVKTVNYKRESEYRKKVATDSYNADIKGAKKKIDALAEAIKLKEMDPLYNGFTEEEVNEIMGQGKLDFGLEDD